MQITFINKLDISQSQKIVTNIESQKVERVELLKLNIIIIYL